MNHKIKNIILPLLFSLLFVAGIITLLVKAASPVSLYLSPSSQSVNKGANFSVAIRVNTQGNSIDYVRTYINFPTDKLSVAGISAGGTSFDYQLESTVSGSQIKISRYSTTGVKSGDMLVATITFSAVNTGTAQVGFDPASLAYYTGGGSSQPSTTSSGGSYSISTPQTPPTTPPTPPVAPPNPPPTPPTTPPASQPPSSNSSPESFVPSSSSGSQEELYPVVITINDHSRNPAAGVEVRAGEASVLTNDTGSVSLLLPAGEQKIFVKSAKVSKQFTVNVEPNAKDDGSSTGIAQEITLTLPRPGLGLVKSLLFGFALVLTAGVAGFLVIFGKKHHRRRSPRPRTPAHAQTETATQSALEVPVPAVPIPKNTQQPAAEIRLHKTHAETVPHAVKPTAVNQESKTVAVDLHPHDKAKTVQPPQQTSLSPTVPPPPAQAAPKPQPVAEKIPQQMPVAAQPNIETPKPAPPPPPKPQPPKPAPPAVEPYKPDGEPKDIFEMAEERFNNDDRLKDLR